MYSPRMRTSMKDEISGPAERLFYHRILRLGRVFLPGSGKLAVVKIRAREIRWPFRVGSARQPMAKPASTRHRSFLRVTGLATSLEIVADLKRTGARRRPGLGPMRQSRLPTRTALGYRWHWPCSRRQSVP